MKFPSFSEFKPSTTDSGGEIIVKQASVSRIQKRAGCWLTSRSGTLIFDGAASARGQALGHATVNVAPEHQSLEFEEALSKLSQWLEDLTKHAYHLCHLTSKPELHDQYLISLSTSSTATVKYLSPFYINDRGYRISPVATFQNFVSEQQTEGDLWILDEDWSAFGTCGSNFLHQRYALFPDWIALRGQLSSYQSPLNIVMARTTEDQANQKCSIPAAKVTSELTSQQLQTFLSFLAIYSDEQVPLRTWLTEQQLARWSTDQESMEMLIEPQVLGNTLIFAVPNVESALKLISMGIERGLHVLGHGEQVVFAPPALVSDDDLDHAITTLSNLLKKIV